MKKKLVISTGAGISAESGISTFRDANGLWENYNVMDVCSADGFGRNPALVHDFYNDRRAQLADVEPNAAHRALVDLEKDFDVYVITQNVDDLHERAGSSHTTTSQRSIASKIPPSVPPPTPLSTATACAPTSCSSRKQCL